MTKKIYYLLMALIFGSLIVFANSKGLLDGSKNFLSQITAPVNEFFVNSTNGFVNFWSTFTRIGSLQEENAELNKKINNLRSEVSKLKALEEENISLRKELDFLDDLKREYVTASIIAYDPLNVSNAITINKGRNDGISEGLAAVFEGVLVGTVSEVGDNYSKVSLITDPRSAIPVSIQGKKADGVVRGVVGSGAFLDKVPQGANIEKGDVIVTSGIDRKIPRGIPIGEVNKIDSKEGSLFISADISLYANIPYISRVLVVK